MREGPCANIWQVVATFCNKIFDNNLLWHGLPHSESHNTPYTGTESFSYSALVKPQAVLEHGLGIAKEVRSPGGTITHLSENFAARFLAKAGTRDNLSSN